MAVFGMTGLPRIARSFVAAALVCGTGLSGCLSDQRAIDAAKAALLEGNGIAVYAAGDIADCRNYRPEDSAAAKTAMLIAGRLAEEKDAAVLTLGDTTYPVGLPIEFANCYEPSWGRFKSRTYPAPGNHDYYTPQAIGYYGYFGAAAGPGRRGYYSFDLGGWHVISLNSNLKPEEQRKQMAWLKKDLEEHPARCTLAYWHHPMYSSGGHGNNRQMEDAWKMLHAAGADLVLSSHDHDYERFAPQDSEGRRDDVRGMREFVVGTGGATLTPFRFRKSNSEVSDNSTHGVLRIVLKERGYEWEFLPVEQGGFSDRGSALCH
jgi:3',5'-cyclic AMP phosphodiesterase CpdA